MANGVKFEIFRSPISRWETLFERAADFASSIGKDRVISISHSSDNNDGVVTVWYWSDSTIRNPEERSVND